MKKIYITYPDSKTELQLFCRETVERHMPEWEIVEILSPIRVNDWPISGKYFKHEPREIVKSDLVRLEAVWNTGGIYLDSDICLLQPIDFLFDNLLPTFWDANPGPDVAMSWLNAMFVAHQHDPIIEELIHASGTGIDNYDPSIATACLVGYHKYLTSIDKSLINRIGIDKIVFSEFIGNIKFNSYDELVDKIVSTKETKPLAIHLTQHSWQTTNTF